MAKKQTRRSISVSRTTYERLKAFCETNNISMSQLVETRVNDFLGDAPVPTMPAAQTGMPRAVALRTSSGPGPGAPSKPLDARPGQVPGAPSAIPPGPPGPPAGSASPSFTAPGSSAGGTAPGASPASASGASGGSGMAATHAAHPAPMTSAAARFAVDPPLPIIKPRQETAAPKPAEKRPEQIFTF